MDALQVAVDGERPQVEVDEPQVVEVDGDGYVAQAHGGLDELLEVHGVGVIARALGDLQHQRGLLLFGGFHDGLDELHVVHVEGTQGVFALEGLGEQVSCVCQWHSRFG